MGATVENADSLESHFHLACQRSVEEPENRCQLVFPERKPTDTDFTPVLDQIAAQHSATARQVALRFLVRRPSLLTIPKASNPDHAAENAGAGELQLTEANLALIGQAFPLGPRPRVLPML
jgi:diketogulonate reductase-like aldo/keto reductase